MRKIRQGRIDKMRSSMMKKRVLLYSAVIFLLAVARGSFFAKLEILPVSPDLVLGAVAAVAVVDSIETAAITGVIGGVITDAVCGFGMYLSPIVYLVVAIAIAMATKKMMPRLFLQNYRHIYRISVSFYKFSVYLCLSARQY